MSLKIDKIKNSRDLLLNCSMVKSTMTFNALNQILNLPSDKQASNK